MMAMCSSNRFSVLKKCRHSRRLIAQRLKVPLNFIIDQDRVRIDTVSKFSSGAFAKAIHAEYHGADVRVKRIHAILTESNRLDLHRFCQECRLASDLRHPNIVHFYGVVMDGSLPMLVMEELLCDLCKFIAHPEKFISFIARFNSESAGGPLSNAHGTNEQKPKPPQQMITERMKISIALGIAQGLDYLHTKKPYPVVHRDLSSSNILLGTFSYKTVAKIADFGQSKEIKSPDDWSSYNPGTLTYLPPEVLRLDTNGEQQQLQQQQPPVLDQMDAGNIEVQAEVQVIDETQTDENDITAAVAAVQQVPEAGAGPVQAEVHVIDQTQTDGNDIVAAVDQEINVEQVPEAQEPDEIQQSQEQDMPKRRRPKLQTSIDMYMYGVLISELGTRQLQHLEKKSSEDSWHAHHVKKIDRLDKDSILYQIAEGCIKENPFDRFKAAGVITKIALQFSSSDIQPNKVHISMSHNCVHLFLCMYILS